MTSTILTLVASILPLFVMTIVNTIVSPIDAVAGSPDLVTAGSTMLTALAASLSGLEVGLSAGAGRGRRARGPRRAGHRAALVRGLVVTHREGPAEGDVPRVGHQETVAN